MTGTPPLDGLAAGLAVALAGAAAPFVVPGLVTPWEASRQGLVAAGFAGLAAHGALLAGRGTRAGSGELAPRSRAVHARLVVLVLAGAAAATVWVVAAAYRAHAWTAFVAHLSAAIPGLWPRREVD